MNYGLPYMGSKNKIAEWVSSYLPKAENLYDLFCGGCAITHCAMVHNKYKNYIINDIKGIMPQLFVDCLNGKYKDEKRWISHDEFFKLRYTDGYVHTCFSFGNKGQSYLYSRSKEGIKKAMHYALMFNNFELLQNFGIDANLLLDISDLRKKYSLLKQIMRSKIGRCDLPNFEALNRLRSIKAYGDIISYSKSYDDIEIRPDSIIYCDIPYKDTGKYNKELFNYDRFYDWAIKQKQLTFISEYDMPSEFICIAEREKSVFMDPNKNSDKTIERLYIPGNQYDTYKKLCLA